MSVYERLGVRPVINARGMNTMAGGSIMPPPVLQAMMEAASAFVDVGELNRRAGEHIARLLGVPAAHVTSGSAGGMLLAAAAVLAGEDPERIARLPDTTGMRDEIVIQRCARIWYDQALRTAGARLVEVGGDETCTEREVRGAIGPRTAALVYIVSPDASEGNTLRFRASLPKRLIGQQQTELVTLMVTATAGSTREISSMASK